MKKILLLALAVALVLPATVQAHGAPLCSWYENGVLKQIPRGACADDTFAVYMYTGSALAWPIYQERFWFSKGPHGNWHAVWVVTPNGVSRRRVKLSARWVWGNHFVVFNHRLGHVWPHG